MNGMAQFFTTDLLPEIYTDKIHAYKTLDLSHYNDVLKSSLIRFQ